MPPSYRIGVDENGLGARLGPLVVTAALARMSDGGERTLSRKLPKRIAEDLNDSKKLVAHGNVTLGEAWARAVAGCPTETPSALFERLSLEGSKALREPCPRTAESQCWTTEGEIFAADDALVSRLSGHLDRLRKKGVDVIDVRTSVVCSHRLNEARSQGQNRFVADLHAMERLILALRERAGADVHAVCGKVGGMDNYARFFGPLSYRPYSVIRSGKRRSEYYFPGVGEVHFVRDADAHDPLVMLASLVGKYVRELLMSRVASFYRTLDDTIPRSSGYHDPTTERFIVLSLPLRRHARIPDGCFRRTGTEGT